MPNCLLLSLRPDRSQIAEVMRGLGIGVTETNDCSMAIDEIVARDWTAVIVESHLPKQHGWDFIRILSSLRTSCRKFILLCDGYDGVPNIDFKVFGITGFLQRPLENPKKVKTIFRTYKII